MKINGEPVELVKDFGELRSGMIVWVTGCLRCGGSGNHRFILVRKDHGEIEGATGEIRFESFYSVAPVAPCLADVVGVNEVDVRSVYRVVDEQFDKEQRSAKSAKPKTKTRAKADQGQR